MKKTIKDPDFGPVELPDVIPSREEFEKAAREIAAAAKEFRAWPRGSTSQCPACSRNSFVGRDDLTFESAKPGSVVVFRHLKGARCEACSAQALEAEDLVAIENETGVGLIGDYEAKVSSIGTGTLGTYWPKDVVRVLRLNPDKRIMIQILDQETALLHFKRGRITRTDRKRSAARSRQASS